MFFRNAYPYRVLFKARPHASGCADSAFFRVIHADGTLCASDPSGNVCLTFFSDRAPIPKTMVEGADDQGFATREFEKDAPSAKVTTAKWRPRSVMSKDAAARLWRRLGRKLALETQGTTNVG
jgi:hypothetical protein